MVLAVLLSIDANRSKAAVLIAYIQFTVYLIIAVYTVRKAAECLQWANNKLKRYYS